MHDRFDERGVPISSGIPPIVVVAVFITFIFVFTLLALVFTNSWVGHVWPWTNAETVPLSH
jgi:ABC-type multidrug transport system permease subunit